MSDDLFTLELLRVAVARNFDNALLREVTLSSWRDDTIDEMVVALKTEVYAERIASETFEVRLERDVHFSQPANWLQHLKEDWNMWVVARCKGHVRLWRFGMRFRFGHVRLKRETRHIVQTQKVRTTQFAAFPESPIRTPEKFRGAVVVRHERTEVVG